MVEFWPSKPAVRVRSPSPAPKDYVVTIAERIHLFPFRTQKLSSLALMVLGGKLPGRVGRSHVIFFCCIKFNKPTIIICFYLSFIDFFGNK